jgi:Tol biopolymer transport system component
MRALFLLTAALVGCGPLQHRAPPSPEAAPAAGPQLFGEGLFTTAAWDFFLAISPDQQRILFCRANDNFTAYDIYETKRGRDGRWSAPARPTFAREWSNADPHISDDGGAVYFISNRPGEGDAGPHDTYDIWTASLEPGGNWGEPRRLPQPINRPHVDEWSPSIAANGDLYFGAERPGTSGGMDLWVAHRIDGRYGEPQNLGDSINTAGHEVEPWISPDGSYLVFSARARKDSVGGYDLYLSRRIDGVWRRATALGHGVNSAALDFNQSVSPNGEWLYFSSTRPRAGGNGKGDIYRIALRELGLAPGP